ncbi:hypothetical protein [Microseira wollei]|nr:hypothetical protein [Microseira wollei]
MPCPYSSKYFGRDNNMIDAVPLLNMKGRNNNMIDAVPLLFMAGSWE